MEVLIDFGLGYNSTLPEDKAVDLYVLERACVAMHSTVGDFVSIQSWLFFLFILLFSFILSAISIYQCSHTALKAPEVLETVVA